MKLERHSRSAAGAERHGGKHATRDRKDRETGGGGLGEALRKRRVFDGGKERKKRKFVRPETPAAIRSSHFATFSLFSKKERGQVEKREMLEMKRVARCERRREGGREETSEERREWRHAGFGRRWEGGRERASRQQRRHAVISIGLKACQDLTLLLRLSVFVSLLTPRNPH